MTRIDWDADKFGMGLTTKLVERLAGVLDTFSLETTLSDSASAAEEICHQRPMACGPRCPHCCVLNVAVLLPEAMRIASWLRKERPAQELAEVRRRLAEHRSWARWMDDEERILKKMSCPLLDAEGSCSVHPVRPLACRAITSLDSGCCLEAFSPVVTDEVRMVPADMLRKEVYDTTFTALAQALELQGLDDRSIELGSGVLAFLEHPEYVKLFLAGEKLPQPLWQ